MGMPRKLVYRASDHGYRTGFAYDETDHVVFTGDAEETSEAVHRWNAHDGLVEALRGTLDASVAYKARLKKTWDMRVSPELEGVIDSAIAALEAAKGGE